jgi:hypothetical protein
VYMSVFMCMYYKYVCAHVYIMNLYTYYKTWVRILSSSNELERRRFLVFEGHFRPKKIKITKMPLKYKEPAGSSPVQISWRGSGSIKRINLRLNYLKFKLICLINSYYKILTINNMNLREKIIMIFTLYKE